MNNSNDDNQPASYLRILLADDNIVEQKIAARMFQDLGYNIDVVSNGFEVVQAVRLKRYDVVLIDEGMPELDAFETASRIRRLPALGKQPWIVSLVMDAHQTFKAKHKEAGINDLLNKPLNEEMLWEALGRIKLEGTEAENNRSLI